MSLMRSKVIKIKITRKERNQNRATFKWVKNSQKYKKFKSSFGSGGKPGSRAFY